MRRIVFYSWQSDLPNATNRGLIQSALENAAAKIAADDSIAVEPVVDRDTLGVPGAPDIASTIFSKITAADVFVADVSIVTRAEGKRSTSNPNVLIELGYALKALGPERVVLVFNKAFGSLDELPFDLRTRRLLIYDLPADAAQKAPARQQLEAQIDAALRSGFVVAPASTASPAPLPAVSAIEGAAPNRRIVLRRALEDLLKRLDDLEPKKHRDGGTVEELIAGIDSTQETVAEFSKTVEAIAVLDDAESALDVYRWFGKVFERYDLPEGYNGRFTQADHDYFKFVGHEMFVTLFGALIKEQRFETLSRLLEEPIFSRLPNRAQSNVGWEYASQHLPLLLQENRTRGRLSVHGDLLKARHAEGGGLAVVAPLQEIMDADFFLFLLSRTLKDTSGYDLRYWRAWSCLSLKRAPLFVQHSERQRYAEKVAQLLGLPNVEAYKELLSKRGPELAKLFSGGFWDYPINQADIEKIGSR